jgi:hypothetical protein
VTEEGEPGRQGARRDEEGRARTAGRETGKLRARPQRRTSAPRAEGEREEPRTSCIVRWRPGSPDAMRSPRRANQLARQKADLHACGAAHPLKNGPIRRCCGSSGVPIGEFVPDRARPRAKRLARRRSGSPDGEAARPTANGFEPPPMKRFRQMRSSSPEDVRARQKMCGLVKRCAGSPEDVRARQRMCGLAVGRARTPSAERARRRASRLAIGWVRSASGKPARRRRSRCKKSAEFAHPRASRFAVGRAGTPKDVQARPSASSLRIRRVRSAAGIGCSRVGERTRAWANELARGRTGSHLCERARRKMNGLTTGCTDSGIAVTFLA